MPDKIKIYVWPDNSLVNEDEVEDIDWYITSNGKSDDFATYDIDSALEAEDIDELIDLKALPGMLPDKVDNTDNVDIPKKIEEMGKVIIPDGAVLVVYHPEDIDYEAVTILKDRMIVNAPNLIMEIIKKKENKDE